jgi:parvulin-like peptidyl-prolyl isomerase
VRSTLLSALESGKSWAEATASAGVTSRRVGPFSLQGERPEGVDVGEFDQVAIQLQPGQLSELTPSTDGGLLVYLEARGTADEEKFKQEENMLRDQMLQARQQIAMMEWLTKERAAAGINPVMMP